MGEREGHDARGPKCLPPAPSFARCPRPAPLVLRRLPFRPGWCRAPSVRVPSLRQCPPFPPPFQITTLQATRPNRAPPTTVAQRRRGALADVAELVSSRGWTALYAGLRPSLLGTAVSQGVYFYLYSLLRDAAVARAAAAAAAAARARGVKPPRAGGAGGGGAPPPLSVGASLLVAFLAGCGNVLLTNPIWVVATRMQAAAKASPPEEASGVVLPPRRVTAVGVARELVAEGGPAALWRGVAPSLVMVANPTVNYMFYEALVARASARRVAKGLAAKPSAGDVFAASAAAKLGATILTYPLLLVKSRLQAAGKHTAAERRYAGTGDAVVRIWREGGLPAFYAGLRTKIVQSILAAALLMAIKEEVATGVRRVLAPAPRRRAARVAALVAAAR